MFRLVTHTHRHMDGCMEIFWGGGGAEKERDETEFSKSKEILLCDIGEIND